MIADPSRRSFRFSTIALGVASAFVLFGLFVGDRALANADRSRTAATAAEVAGRTERLLARHVAAANRLVPLFADSSLLTTAATLLRAVETLDDGAVPAPWLVIDSAGVIVALGGTGRTSLNLRTDLDTVQRFALAAAMARARTSRAIQTSARGDIAPDVPGFVLLRPVHRGTRFLGAVGTTLGVTSLLDSLGGGRADEHMRVVIRAGSDTLATHSTHASEGAEPHVTHPVRAPDGASWEVDVVKASSVGSLRLALWAIGLTALAALLLAQRHDRRQSLRIADRSGELEHLSGELLRANRMKSEFLANISHELRTPLNAIVGFVELLRDGVYGELAPRQVGPVQRIEASASHLRHLVDQILDLAKMAAGRLEVHTEIMDLRPFVIDVASDIEPLVTERGLTLSLAVGGTLPRVRTDPTHLRQILANLLSNAVKHTQRGSIAIRARLVRPAHERRGQKGERSGEAPIALAMQAPRQDAHWLAIQVIDSGVGIALTDQERVFDEFEQVNPGPRGDSMNRGTGLGLPISRRLARLLGGEILLESEPGKGSTFTLWLPVDPADLRETSGAAPALR